MKKMIFIIFVSFFCMSIEAEQKEKVILDTDMVEMFDDGITMLMLAQAPNVDLLGVTVVVGNTWVPEGTAYAIRQLEAVGRTDIPVVPGIRFPLSPNRADNIKAEIALYGIGDGYLGSAGYPEPASWQAVYREKYGAEPNTQPLDMNAVNFIIDRVKKHPGEITLMAIGTCTNLAAAVRMAPEIVPMIKRVIYMGGSFFKAGNTSPAAEFNWWLDPNAARIAVRSPFKEQIVIGLDVCEKIPFRKERYDRIIAATAHPELKTMLERNYLIDLYRKDRNYTHYVWDVICGAILIDPSLITEEITRHIDVNDQFGLSYGASLAFETSPPSGTQPARIIMTVDADKLWNMIETYCKTFRPKK